MSKTVREWMQMEIWSQRTTRRLFKVVGVVLVVGCIAGLVWTYWLNPFERRDVFATLEQARNIRNSSKESFGQEQEKGKEIESQAENAAWTLRDKRVEMVAGVAVTFATDCRKFELTDSSGATSEKVAETFQHLAESTCEDYETFDTLTRYAIDRNSVSRKDLWQIQRTLEK